MSARAQDVPATHIGRKIDGPIRVLIVTRVIEPGGAERQLLAFLQNADRARLAIDVACYYRGSWHDEASAISGIAVHDLGKQGRYDVLGFGSRLLRLARSLNPDIVYGYHGGWLPALAAARAVGVPVIWGLRNSEPVSRSAARGARLLGRATGILSRLVDGFIANSAAGAAAYAAAGYPRGRIAIIPNGIDTDRFALNSAARARLRAAWKVGADDVLVGLVGRLDRRKNYGDAIVAAGRLATEIPALKVVHVGGGDLAYRAELQALATEVGMADRCTWVSHMDEVGDAFGALDVFVLPSTTEGFSNALAEALASERAVIANDVGDCRYIVGDAGYVVRPGDRDAITAALRAVAVPGAQRLRDDLGRRARKRIVDMFGMKAMADATTRELIRIADRGRRGAARRTA